MRHRSIPAALLLCLLAVPAIGAQEPALETDEQKTLYTLGLAISRNLALLEFNEAELALIQAGMRDGAMRRAPRVEPEQYGPRIDAMLQARMTGITEKEKAAGKAFRELAAQEPGAQTTDSGLVYRDLEPGNGAAPGATDSVKVHYRGTLRDGSMFDTSLEGENPEPVTFNLSGVVPCFSEGIRKMKVGGKSKLTCPPELAYGDRGSPPAIKPGTTLQFEVQLLEIVPPAAAEEGPSPTTP